MTVTSKSPFVLILKNAAQTRELGRRVGTLIQKSLNLALIGQLGSGKTVFAKGLAAGLGVSDKEPVTSPTYTIINEYTGLFHIDLYRLNGVDDAEAAGVLELLEGPRTCAVEWAELLFEEDLGDHLRLDFTVIDEERREIRMMPCGENALQLLNRLRELQWD